MPIEEFEGETAAIASLARDAAVQVIGHNGRAFLVRPETSVCGEITDPHGLSPEPSRIRQKVMVQTVDSLVDYCNTFKTPETLLLADIAASLIVAPLDYHGPTKPSNVDHRAGLQLTHSEEWRIWTQVSGRLMPQLEFARFIEENGADIKAPPGAELLEVVRDLQAKRKVDFTRAVRTASDNENFEFSDTTEAKSRGSIEIPSRFELAIPVYFGEGSTRLDAFLRWRLNDTQLTLGIQLHRAEHVRQAVFREIVERAAKGIGVMAVFGKLAE